MKNSPDIRSEFGQFAHEPLALNTMGPYKGNKGEPICFNAAVSGGSKPYNFFWEFGDGGSAAGQSVHYTYAASGTFVVTLKVTDGNSKSKRVYTSATIENVAVNVDLGPERTALAWESLDFRAVLTGGGSPGLYSYRWDFGDETPVQEAARKNSHTYAFPGKYIVTVEVSDGEGQVGRAILPVTVMEQPTVVTADESPMEKEIEAPPKQENEMEKEIEAPPKQEKEIKISPPEPEEVASIPSSPHNQTATEINLPGQQHKPGLNPDISGISGELNLLPLSDKFFTVTPGNFQIITLGNKEINPPGEPNLSEGPNPPDQQTPSGNQAPPESQNPLKQQNIPGGQNPSEQQTLFEQVNPLKEENHPEEQNSPDTQIPPEQHNPVRPEQKKPCPCRPVKKTCNVKIRGPF